MLDEMFVTASRSRGLGLSHTRREEQRAQARGARQGACGVKRPPRVVCVQKENREEEHAALEIVAPGARKPLACAVVRAILLHIAQHVADRRAAHKEDAGRLLRHYEASRARPWGGRQRLGARLYARGRAVQSSAQAQFNERDRLQHVARAGHTACRGLLFPALGRDGGDYGG